MSVRPSTDLTGACRAFLSLVVLLALGSPSARAEPLDAGPPAESAASDAQAAPLPGPRVRQDDEDAQEDAEESSDRRSATDLKYLLERVEVVGNRKTKLDMVKKFVPLEVGTSFNVADPEIEALRYRLLGTGWYDKVELALKRGSRPGWVVLVIQVEERRTLVFQELAAGLGWSSKYTDPKDGPDAKATRKPQPYLGLSLADTNFLGTGKTLGGEVLVSPDQQGVAIAYNDPVVRSSNWGFRTRGTFVRGQEYFGGDANVFVSSSCTELGDDQKRQLDECERHSRAAVVEYWRGGLSLGTGRDVGSFTRLTLDWRGDFVNVPRGGIPDAAAEQRGRNAQSERAIDFAIEPGNSFFSTLSLGFTYDKRDSAILPSRGTLASFLGDLSSPLIGSDNQFVRLQAHVNHWFSLNWRHTIRLGLFMGAVFGDAPFFYKFFVTDLTDLQPSRIMGLNLDHRPAPNLFGVLSGCRPFNADCGTAIAQVRQEELAARIDAEYVWPLVRGRRKFVKGADAYFLLGLYALADPNDFRLAMPGYSGISRLPVDLTLDVGVRLDTQIGVFQVGLAKLFWAAFP